MKKLALAGLVIGIVGLFCAMSAPHKPETNTTDAPIKWMSWDEAIKASENQPKKIFIDVYTDWCGWCKRMDKSTFTDPEVADYLNKHFYAVKFDAEQKDDIVYKGNTLKYMATGRRGVHELAYALLDGRLGYPAFVYLDENQDRITISPGYKTPEVIIKELKYVAGEHYKTTSYEDFTKNSQ